MKEKTKKTLIIILISIVALTIATSTAYLMMNILPSLNNPENLSILTDKLTLVYTDCAENEVGNCENTNKDLGLGESITKTFQIKNESNKELNYTLYFKHLQNTFKKDELVYKIENIDTGEVLVDTTPVPYREVKAANVIIKESISIAKKSTQKYRMTVTFLNKDYNQNENLNAIYSLKLSIVPDGVTLTEGVSNEIMAVNYNTNDKLWKHKTYIKKVIFEDTMIPKENASYTYDISSAQNGSVMSYLVPDTEDNTQYIAYIQSDGETIANSNSADYFYRFTNLISIEGLNNLNTSNVTNMSSMFAGCTGLTSLDLSSFNTSNVTSMSSMFLGCTGLTSLNLSSFDTSKITDMSNMFEGCTGLTSLNLSNFDTSNVAKMSSMFSECQNLSANMTIIGTNCTSYADMFKNTSINSSTFTLNYTSDASDLVDKMIATQSTNSNVVKGSQEPNYTITITGTTDIQASEEQGYFTKEIILSSTLEGKIITSFKMNGTLIHGSSFKMPRENVIISDVILTDGVESTHYPYPNNLNDEEYLNKTYEGATSLTVGLEYQTEGLSRDYIYLYDKDNNQYGKYGGQTKLTETITIPGDKIRITFRTDSSGNNYYGFKATITPNY